MADRRYSLAPSLTPEEEKAIRERWKKQMGIGTPTPQMVSFPRVREKYVSNPADAEFWKGLGFTPLSAQESIKAAPKVPHPKYGMRGEPSVPLFSSPPPPKSAPSTKPPVSGTKPTPKGKKKPLPAPKSRKTSPLPTQRTKIGPFQPSAFPLPADWDTPKVPPFRPSSSTPIPGVPPSPSSSLDQWQSTSQLGQLIDNLRLTSGEAATRLGQNPLDDRSMRVFSRKLARLNKRSPVAGNMYAEEFANQLPAESMAKKNLMDALAKVQAELAQSAATTEDIRATTKGRREGVETSKQARTIVGERWKREQNRQPIIDQAFSEAEQTPELNPFTRLALKLQDLTAASSSWPGMSEGERIARLQAQTSSNNMAAQLANARALAREESINQFGTMGIPGYAVNANQEGMLQPGTWQKLMQPWFGFQENLAGIKTNNPTNMGRILNDNLRRAQSDLTRMLLGGDKVPPADLDAKKAEVQALTEKVQQYNDMMLMSQGR